MERTGLGIVKDAQKNVTTLAGTIQIVCKNVECMSTEKDCTASKKSPVKAGNETVNERKRSDILYSNCSLSVKYSITAIINYVHHWG